MPATENRLALPSPTFLEVGLAIDRLIVVANSDTGGSRRTADFLLAWWNGADWGHFPVVHLGALEREIAEDMILVMLFLARNGVWYADAWRRREAIEHLIDQWREIPACVVSRMGEPACGSPMPTCVMPSSNSLAFVDLASQAIIHRSRHRRDHGETAVHHGVGDGGRTSYCRSLRPARP